MLTIYVLATLAAMATADVRGGAKEVDLNSEFDSGLKVLDDKLNRNAKNELTNLCARDVAVKGECDAALRALQNDNDEKKAIRDTFFAVSEARLSELPGLLEEAETAKAAKKRGEAEHQVAVAAFERKHIEHLIAANVESANANDAERTEAILAGLEKANDVEVDVKAQLAKIEELREELDDAIAEAERKEDGAGVSAKQTALNNALKAFEARRAAIEALLPKKGERFNAVSALIDSFAKSSIVPLIFNDDLDAKELLEEAKQTVSIRHAVLAAKDADNFQLVDDLSLEFSQVTAVAIGDNADKSVTYEYVCAQDTDLDFDNSPFSCDVQLANLADRADVEFESFNAIPVEFIDVALEAPDVDDAHLAWKANPKWGDDSGKVKPGDAKGGYNGEAVDKSEEEDEEDSASAITLALGSFVAMIAAQF